MGSEQVRVIVRCRGPSPPNHNRLGTALVLSPSNKVVQCEGRLFHFDAVLDCSTSQETVFGHVKGHLQACWEGINSTIFAYGQTGSGKTHTIDGQGQDPGILPRCFDMIMRDARVKKVVAEFLEVYNETVKDLLHPLTADKESRIQIRDRSDGSTWISGQVTRVVESAEELHQVLRQGRQARVTGHTKMNSSSSRSHAIFTLTIFGEDNKYAKLNIVDLAGSERWDQTQSEGARFIEATRINLSLTCLGHVISSLTGRSQDAHIPYRDSKLTRILKDSLGGNSRTLMIATISPDDSNGSETLSTLRFADRVKNVRNTVSINRTMSDKDEKDRRLAELKAELQLLRGKVVEKSDALRVSSVPVGDEELRLKEANEQRQLQERVRELEDELATRQAEREAAERNHAEFLRAQSELQESHQRDQKLRLQGLYQLYMSLKLELRDQKQDHHTAMDQLHDSVRYLESEIQSYQRLLRTCIPKSVLQLVVKDATYDDVKERWEIKGEDLAGFEADVGGSTSRAEYMALVARAWNVTQFRRRGFRSLEDLGLDVGVLERSPRAY